MAEFKPIETQEEFDAAIKDRLHREGETIRKEYADYDDLKKAKATYEDDKKALEKTIGEGKTRIKELEDQIKESNKKIHGYELDALKTKVATEAGLPFELRGRLNGDTEEELRKDAENFRKSLGPSREQPRVSHEGKVDKSSKDAAVRKLAKDLTE